MAYKFDDYVDQIDIANKEEIRKAAGAVVAVVSHYDEQVHTVGVDELTQRIDTAIPILRGITSPSDQWAETIAALEEPENRLVHQVVAGRIKASQLAFPAEVQQLRQQLDDYASGRVVDAVTPTQALTEAITASVAAAAKAATLSTEVTALATEVDKASNELGKALPDEEHIKAVGVGGGTVKKWRTLTEAVETAEQALLTKQAELEAAAKDAKEKAEAVQQELQSVAQAASSQARQHSPMSLSAGNI